MLFLLFLLVLAVVMLPLLRFLFLQFGIFRIAFGAIPDLINYVRYKKWRECPSYGKICCYTGLFGQGKTKEAVRFVVGQYKKYNGRMIYDQEKRLWVPQKIVIYSNVVLNVPYINLVSLQQLVDCQGSDFGTVNLFLIDEASVVFNSREFKKNFSTPALNTILTSRHHKIGIYLTSQRFGHMDALLRQVTTDVYECNYFKPFRVQRIKLFDAWEIENCTNLNMIRPLKVMYHYTTNKDYNNYDTYAMVSAISKECSEGGFISDSEVLSLQGSNDGDVRLLNKPKRKLSKRM